jgi:hypothetical protein
MERQLECKVGARGQAALRWLRCAILFCSLDRLARQTNGRIAPVN